MILKKRQRRTCVSRVSVLSTEGEERTSKPCSRYIEGSDIYPFEPEEETDIFGLSMHFEKEAKKSMVLLSNFLNTESEEPMKLFKRRFEKDSWGVVVGDEKEARAKRRDICTYLRQKKGQT